MITILWIGLDYKMKKNSNDIKTATILMCTYNAEKYIQEQLLSLVNQSYTKIMIYINDDKSTDNTINIIHTFMKNNARYSEIIKISINEKKLGASENFRKNFMEHKDAQYLFFCDQDDVWDYDKVSIMMLKMLELERTNDMPYLICHNPVITDAFGKIIEERKVKGLTFTKLILHPKVQGCCMLLNRKAIELIDLEGCYMYMYDWYISLIISLYGTIIHIEEGLVFYRQHENNVVGYKKLTFVERVLLIFSNYTQKLSSYSKAYSQLISLHYKFLENEFLNDFFKMVNRGEILGVLKLLKTYGVFDKGYQMIYQMFLTTQIIKKHLLKLDIHNYR